MTNNPESAPDYPESDRGLIVQWEKVTLDKSGYQEYNGGMEDSKNQQQSALPTPVVKGLLTRKEFQALADVPPELE